MAIKRATALDLSRFRRTSQAGSSQLDWVLDELADSLRAPMADLERVSRAAEALDTQLNALVSASKVSLLAVSDRLFELASVAGKGFGAEALDVVEDWLYAAAVALSRSYYEDCRDPDALVALLCTMGRLVLSQLDDSELRRGLARIEYVPSLLAQRAVGCAAPESRVQVLQLARALELRSAREPTDHIDQMVSALYEVASQMKWEETRFEPERTRQAAFAAFDHLTLNGKLN